MTDKPTPKEIDDLVYELRQAGKDDTYSLASAVLAKWGQPAHSGEPLTEAQVQALIEAKHFRNGYELKASDRVCLDWYRLGLRDGEAAHGIKGGQHGADT